MASPVLACTLALLSMHPPLARLASGVVAPEEGEAEGDGGEEPSETGEDPASEAVGSYEDALAAIDQANLAVNREPEANIGVLEQAIEDLLRFGPDIANDPKGREALDLSQLNLARALLMAEAEDRAAEVMDDVLRAAHDRKLPVKRFGPTLANFHDDRRKLLDEQGKGSIQVLCRTACRIVIDEQAASSDSGPLYLGPHRVWVEAADGSAEPLQTTVEVTAAGVSEVVQFPVSEEEAECEVIAAPVMPPPPVDDTPKRILPRWAEIGALGLGVGAVVLGGVLMGMDGKCAGGGDPSTCPEVWESTVSGVVSLGVGGAFLVLGGVTLAVDEVRVGKQRGRQAMVTWTVRF